MDGPDLEPSENILKINQEYGLERNSEAEG